MTPDRIGKESALERRRYRRQEKAKESLQQQVFCLKEGELELKENPSRYAQLTEKSIDPYQNVTCPFCLGLNPLRLFLISTKKGYNRDRGKCPLCGQQSKFHTLLKVMTSPEQYATFAYPYAKMGFWQKVSFNIWKKRLAAMGWTERFWNEYKRLRGDPEKEEEEKRLAEETAAYEQLMSDPERLQQEQEEFKKKQQEQTTT